jgi:hypothetical protein
LVNKERKATRLIESETATTKKHPDTANALSVSSKCLVLILKNNKNYKKICVCD